MIKPILLLCALIGFPMGVVVVVTQPGPISGESDSIPEGDIMGTSNAVARLFEDGQDTFSVSCTDPYDPVTRKTIPVVVRIVWTAQGAERVISFTLPLHCGYHLGEERKAIVFSLDQMNYVALSSDERGLYISQARYVRYGRPHKEGDTYRVSVGSIEEKLKSLLVSRSS